MSALEIYEAVFYVYIKSIAKICFANFFDPNYKIRPGVYAYVMSGVIGISCLLYTVASRDRVTGLNACTGWGVLIQVFVLFHSK